MCNYRKYFSLSALINCYGISDGGVCWRWVKRMFWQIERTLRRFWLGSVEERVKKRGVEINVAIVWIYALSCNRNDQAQHILKNTPQFRIEKGSKNCFAKISLSFICSVQYITRAQHVFIIFVSFVFAFFFCYAVL